jgi:hypothetical protein
MVLGEAPVRRRPNTYGKMQRRKRIFARLREGLSYDEIALEERLTGTRIRQIVSEVLQKRVVDNGADHAKLQLDRLAPALQFAAEAMAAGEISAITPYLKALDRLDRYQTVACANQGYDDEDRRKLMERINRMAENLGIDEVIWKKADEHLKAMGQIPADEPSEPETAGDPADALERRTEPPEEPQGDPGETGAAGWMAV